MPNWCENNLIIKADGKDAEPDFNRLERLLGETLIYSSSEEYITNLLGSIICMPSQLEGTTKEKPYKLEDGTTIWWYEWCCDNWGTKWDASDCIMKYKHNELRFTFNTAWNPPIPWLEKVALIFPNLWIELTYNEPGIQFRGFISGRGELIDEYEEY